MNCLKCGRETKDGAVFCEGCRAVMKKHPVKPSATLQLPRREMQEPTKKPSKRKKVPLEERVRRQKKLIRRMALAIAALCVLIALLAGYIVLQRLTKPEEPVEAPTGRNYTTQQTQ